MAEEIISQFHPLGSRTKDISGQRFGRLVALSAAGKNRHGHCLWLCRCDCGQEKVVKGESLKRGDTASCGCIVREQRHTLIKDISGQRFGRLVALSYSGSDRRGQAMWLCLCDCGAEKAVLANSIKRGLTTSCGCLHREAITKPQDFAGQRFGRWLVLRG
jgi:hypothetical protein